jgi:hypothetical protein
MPTRVTRWPITTVMAIVAAGLFAAAGDWVWAVVLLVAALVLGTLTFRSMR